MSEEALTKETNIAMTLSITERLACRKFSVEKEEIVGVSQRVGVGERVGRARVRGNAGVKPTQVAVTPVFLPLRKLLHFIQ